jgi:hypothetical protein
VLEDQNVNTCNNEVANRIDVALDQDFSEVPAYLEVGRRLLRAGFFGADVDDSILRAPSEQWLAAMARALGESVAELAKGNHEKLVIDSFTTATDHLTELIDVGYIFGTAIRKKLLDLQAMIDKLEATRARRHGARSRRRRKGSSSR